VFGSAGAFGLLAMVGLGVALAHVHLQFFDLSEIGTPTATIPKQPATTCAAFDEVRQAGSAAWRAQNDADAAAGNPRAPLPANLAPSLQRLDNALAFATPLSPPAVQADFIETRGHVQYGRVYAAKLPTARAYTRAASDDFFTGGAALLRAFGRIDDACGHAVGELTPAPSR
jgi:hypothetical protein